MKANEFKATYIGFGHCHCCKKKRALRELPNNAGWVCRRCWQDGVRSAAVPEQEDIDRQTGAEGEHP